MNIGDLGMAFVDSSPCARDSNTGTMIPCSAFVDFGSGAGEFGMNIGASGPASRNLSAGARDLGKSIKVASSVLMT